VLPLRCNPNSASASSASLSKTEAHQIVPLHSHAFRNWLIHQFFSEHEILPRASVLREVIHLLEAKTQFGNVPRVQISRRVASAPGKVILDLYNDQGEVVEISPTGWHVTQNLGVYFRSSRSARPLPHPEKSAAALAKLRAVLHLTPEHFTRCMSWLTSAMSPAGPYPILVVQGAGKSSVASLLRSLIDPGSAPFCPAPNSSRDLQSLAAHNWILALDRIEQRPSRMLRHLIRLSTGETFAARDRPSDPEPFHVFLERPLLFTTSAALAPELAACAVIIEAPVVVVADDRLRPQILGALCDAVSASMTPGKTQFANNGIADAVGLSMQNQAEWTGTATELLARLRTANPSIQWPATAKGLSQLLGKTSLGAVTFKSVQHPQGHRSIQLRAKMVVLAKDAQTLSLAPPPPSMSAPKRAAIMPMPDVRESPTRRSSRSSG